MDSVPPQESAYENKYAILGDNLHDRYGMLPSLDKIVQDADVIIIDTPLIPTVYKDITRLQPRQARNVCFLYKALEDIFASPKVRVHPAVYSEMKSLLGKEQQAAQQLGTDLDFQKYRQAITQLIAHLPQPTPVPKEHSTIFSEFLNALDYIDASLELRYHKRHMKDAAPTTVDLQNMAYALTMSVVNPDKSYVLLSRDIDYERIFDKTISLAYSANFSMKNRNGETVPQKLGNPKFSITYCDEQKKNQPFSIVRNTITTPIGAEFVWEKESGQTQETIMDHLRLNLSKVIYELQGLRQAKQLAVAALPVVSTASLSQGAIRNLYEAMRVTKEEIAQKYEQGRLGAVLEGYCTVSGLAKQTNDKKTLADMKTDLQAIEKYLLVAQKKEAITEKNVKQKDEAGELEQIIEQQRKLRATAQFLGMEELANAANQSLGIVKGYVKKVHTATKQNVHNLGKEIESTEKDLEDLRTKHKKWKEQDTYYERLEAALKGEKMVELNAIVIGQHEPKKRTVAGHEEFGTAIYNNLCTALGHAPVEGESVGKKYLVQAMGIYRTLLSKIVKRAGIDALHIPLGKGNAHFVFSNEVMKKLGLVLKDRPQELSK